MSWKTRIIGGGLAAVALGLLAGAGAWYFVLRSDAPPPVSLAAAIESASTASALTPAASAAAEAGLEGEWTLVQGATSFVGYRVQEELAGIGSTTAVGRTQSVEGNLTFDGSAITEVEITVNLSTLASDKSMRDNALRMQALETGAYPTATFVLATPITIASVPNESETISQTVKGNLTLHGVTNEITLRVQGVIQAGQLLVVGSTDIEFADYNIEQPRAAAVLSVEDHGTLELQLTFAKA
jgi:polyisoprenoid-binding protein YceI